MNYSKNYGFYNSTRYATRLFGLGFGTYYLEEIKFHEIYLVYSIVTVFMILFIIIYFQELRVRNLHIENLRSQEETQIFRTDVGESKT